MSDSWTTHGPDATIHLISHNISLPLLARRVPTSVGERRRRSVVEDGVRVSPNDDVDIRNRSSQDLVSLKSATRQRRPDARF